VHDLDFLATWLVPLLLLAVVARWATELGLASLNRRHILAHAGAVPEALGGAMDETTYRRSTEYALARNRFERFELTFESVILIALLLTGVLPRVYEWVVTALGGTGAAVAAAILVAVMGLSVLSLPLAWHEQFRLEHRFGFNTTTARTWWIDRIKGSLLLAGIGYPILWLVVKLPDWMGPLWWLWAAAALAVIQLLMAALAPTLILPLFNRFTPLPDGPLRDRLLALCERTGFRSRTVLVMDGSRRSRHSNAFFTGFGRFRRIVLFDTLLSQLEEPELEAVLAHEIGHYQLGHVPLRLMAAAVTLVVSFAAVGWLASLPWFAAAFGFALPGVGPVLLLALVFGGVISFWSSPGWNVWSRRHEYQADRFAAEVVGGPSPLVRALRKLALHNLSNLTPHPFYSGFHYSHPTLLERETALGRHAG
jgi:STE24 endopeptidase